MKLQFAWEEVRDVFIHSMEAKVRKPTLNQALAAKKARLGQEGQVIAPPGIWLVNENGGIYLMSNGIIEGEESPIVRASGERMDGDDFVEFIAAAPFVKECYRDDVKGFVVNIGTENIECFTT